MMGVTLRVDVHVGECPASGDVGIMFDAWPNTDYLYAIHTANAFAHDLVEHINGPAAMGTLRDELEALGAALFVRGVDIASDLDNMNEYASEADESRLAPVDDVEIDECDWGSWIDGLLSDFKERHKDQENIDHVCAYFRSHMRAGLKKACDKYGGTGVAYELFHNAGLAFEDLSSNGLDSLEGASFTVVITECGYSFEGLDEIYEESECDDE